MNERVEIAVAAPAAAVEYPTITIMCCSPADVLHAKVYESSGPRQNPSDWVEVQRKQSVEVKYLNADCLVEPPVESLSPPIEEGRNWTAT